MLGGAEMYEWIKEVSDGEIYSDGKRHFLLTWGWATGNETGAHNFYNTDILIQEGLAGNAIQALLQDARTDGKITADLT